VDSTHFSPFFGAVASHLKSAFIKRLLKDLTSGVANEGNTHKEW
jgi:hypothetical protein